MPSSLRIRTYSPEETQRVGRIIGSHAREGDIFLLAGPLGSGKTCLTQGIAWGLEVPGYARSPTFVLQTRYRGRLTLHHMDLYRINGPLEAWDLGLEEQLLGDGVCVVEWADRAREVFPDDCLWIHLAHTRAEHSEAKMAESQRTITFQEGPPRYACILAKLADAFSLECSTISCCQGAAP